jgi:hypothetical protein
MTRVRLTRKTRRGAQRDRRVPSRSCGKCSQGGLGVFGVLLAVQLVRRLYGCRVALRVQTDLRETINPSGRDSTRRTCILGALSTVNCDFSRLSFPYSWILVGRRCLACDTHRARERAEDRERNVRHKASTHVVPQKDSLTSNRNSFNHGEIPAPLAGRIAARQIDMRSARRGIPVRVRFLPPMRTSMFTSAVGTSLAEALRTPRRETAA